MDQGAFLGGVVECRMWCVVDGVYFEHDSGAEIEAACINYEETFRIKRNWSDLLTVAITSEEITSWLGGY